MPITSGSIEYERRLNLGEYNHKNVVAKVSWVVDLGEDEDVLADDAVYKAVSRVRDALNWKPTEPLTDVEKHNVQTALAKTEQPNLETMAAPNLAAQHPVAEITAGIPPVLKRHRRTKAEMEAARAAEANPTNQTLPDGQPSSATTEPGMPSFGSFDPDLLAPAEVTDQDLLDACQAKVLSGKSSDAIKELVASFSPGKLVQTPQDARRRFLEELAKL